jgi:hypothetical protein
VRESGSGQSTAGEGSVGGLEYGIPTEAVANFCLRSLTAIAERSPLGWANPILVVTGNVTQLLAYVSTWLSGWPTAGKG